MPNKSACRLLINKTYREIWERGEDYADNASIEIFNYDNRYMEAKVRGTKKYWTSLEFYGNGMRRFCNCPYAESHSDRTICKHMVAVAILWDKARGIARPDSSEIEEWSMERPQISRSEIDALYGDPLNADLEALRILADETALGNPRPHARLPNMPKLDISEKKELSLQEVKKAFSEIGKWTGRRNYDPYFCAGEMTAAFCEVMRRIIAHIDKINLSMAVDILVSAQQFNQKLIMEYIDDSQGLHAFTEAHLEDLFDKLNEQASGNDKILKKLRSFEKNRENY